MPEHPWDLTGKRILVTGASSGIGAATARVISQWGGVVVLLARDAERLRQTRDSLAGPGHALYQFDLTQLDDIPGLLKRIARDQGPLAGLVHAAGVSAVMQVGIIKPHHLEAMFAVNVHAALMLARGFCQAGVKAATGASLVFMSSAAAICGVAGMSVYAASKAALAGAVRSLACELAPRSIRVNAILAGAVRTTMHEGLTVNRLSGEAIAGYERRHPLGLGEPEDIAQAAGFLLSEAARWITGTGMVVDGGYACA